MNTLLSMTISASVLIAAIIVIRSLFIHRLPKRLFVLLWAAAALRMLIPFSFSFDIPREGTVPANAVVVDVVRNETQHSPAETSGGAYRELIFELIWAGGVVISAGIFAALHLRSRKELSTALPLDNAAVNSRISEEKLRRKITVKVSDRVTSPLTYGIINPVIILPKNPPADSEEMRFALAHELVHIRRFDVLLKIMLTAAACVHWFNPLAWAMLSLANRDIELSCDEAVLKQLGCRREDYAMALIRFEEKRSVPTEAAFGRNAVRERIEAIMKFRKTTLVGIIVSACLIAGTTTAFAAVSSDKPESPAADEYVTETSEITTETNETTAETDVATITEFNTDTEMTWWTYDEYSKWLEQEKQYIANLVESGAEGWSQEDADETIALFEQQLEDIKDGVPVAQFINADDVILLSPSDNKYTITDETDGTEYTIIDTTQPGTFEINDEEFYTGYEEYNMTYEDGKLYYNGEPVKFFDDTAEIQDGAGVKTDFYRCYLDPEGKVVVTAVRENADENSIGDLTGLKVLTEEELEQKKAELGL